MPRKTYVYIDGFNLYYGALAGGPYKWLDVHRVCREILTDNEVVKIKYFTARVSARLNDPDQPNRQETYFRALRTIPGLEIHYGHFLSNIKSMPLAKPTPTQKAVRVWSTQEKGSDVNLAAHLLLDACKGNFEVAVLVTNDSDLYTPAKMVKDEYRKTVGIINPHAINPGSKPSRQLIRVASFFKPIRQRVLETCQFPTQMEDEHGIFHKPERW